jgi:hypothetical protein
MSINLRVRSLLLLVLLAGGITGCVMYGTPRAGTSSKATGDKATSGGASPRRPSPSVPNFP